MSEVAYETVMITRYKSTNEETGANSESMSSQSARLFFWAAVNALLSNDEWPEGYDVNDLFALYSQSDENGADEGDQQDNEFDENEPPASEDSRFLPQVFPPASMRGAW